MLKAIQYKDIKVGDIINMNYDYEISTRHRFLVLEKKGKRYDIDEYCNIP